jgi:hypothetical protein
MRQSAWPMEDSGALCFLRNRLLALCSAQKSLQNPLFVAFTV